MTARQTRLVDRVWFFAPLLLVGVACSPNGPVDEGSPAVCGDGVLGPDELCDDGNLIGGDGCSVACVPSGTLYDCVDVRVSDEPGDGNWVGDLLPLPDGSFVASGWTPPGWTFTESELRGWIARFSQSGERMWAEEVAIPDTDVRLTDLVADGETGFWVLASVTDQPDRLIYFNQSGSESGNLEIESGAGAPVVATAIMPVQSSVWVGGSIAGDAWLGRYDPESGGTTDILIEDYLGYDDVVSALARTSNEIIAVMTVSTTPHNDGDIMLKAETEALVVRFDENGTETGRSLVGNTDDSEYARGAYEVVLDTAGRWFVVGRITPMSPIDPLAQLWLAPAGGESGWESGWEWMSTDPISPEWGGAIGTNDGVMLAMNHAGDDAHYGSLVGIGADGALRWESSVIEEAYAHRVLAKHLQGEIRTIGDPIDPDVGQTNWLRSCLVAF